MRQSVSYKDDIKAILHALGRPESVAPVGGGGKTRL